MRADRELYSHCPLKKRPVLLYQDTQVESNNINAEPENLSTKPEDLQLSCKILTPATGDSSISCKKPLTEGRTTGDSIFRECQEESSGALNHIISSKVSSPSPWHRLTAPFYPPYLYSYHFPDEVCGHYYSSGISREHLSSSDVCRGNSTLFTPPQVLVPKPTKTFHANEHGRFSPSPLSSSNRFFLVTSSLPTSPEELLSPRSVSSCGGSSTGSIGYGEKVKYQCSCCFKSYSTVSGLNKHRQNHLASTAKKTFSCTSCKKVYVSSGALKMHIRTHTLPCKCFICGKAFSRPWLLQGHIRTHTGEKPFSCPLCERAFADRSNLRAHLQTHSEVKRYSCSNCGKTFSRMSLLTKHLDNGCPGDHSLRDFEA